jgi:hypothetical protein
MESMANPMNALLEIQEALNSQTPFDVPELGGGYKTWPNEYENGKTHSFAKIINGEIQALAIFGLVNPVNGIECWSLGYAVSENYRRRGLAVEAVKKGLEELKKIFSRASLKSFYIEGVIDIENDPSIKLAEKIFSSTGRKIIDEESGRRALLFEKLIVI